MPQFKKGDLIRRIAPFRYLTVGKTYKVINEGFGLGEEIVYVTNDIGAVVSALAYNFVLARPRHFKSLLKASLKHRGGMS